MPSPLAWLSGLGRASAGLGQDLNTRALLEQQQRRQAAQDALARLVTLQSIGGTEIGPGTDPTALLRDTGTYNQQMRGDSAIPNAALDLPDTFGSSYQAPNMVKLPTPDGSGFVNVMLDPSKTPQAQMERRQENQQLAADRRQEGQQAALDRRQERALQAASDLKKQEDAAKTLAGVKAARADYNTLKATNPKHPLVQAPFDPDNAVNYGNALKFEESKQLQASAYHPPISEGDWAPSGAIDPTTQEPILYNKKTGEKKALTGTISKPGAGAAGQNAPQMAAAKANLESAMQIMDEYEDKLKHGQAKYGVLGGTEGALASSPAALNAKGPLGAMESLLANAASSHLQTSNPDLARYLTAKKYVAEAILNTHKRPNQTQYEIEQEISGAGPNASTEQIDMAADRRRRMKREVFENPAAGAVTGAPSGSGGGKPPLTDRVIQLKAQGLSKEAARAQLIREGYNLGGTP